MGKIKVLNNTELYNESSTSENVYPVTYMEAVYNEDKRTLPEYLEEEYVNYNDTIQMSIINDLFK